MVVRVLTLFIPLPMFWALFDQQVLKVSLLLRQCLKLFLLNNEPARSEWAFNKTFCLLLYVPGIPLDSAGHQDEHGVGKGLFLIAIKF